MKTRRLGSIIFYLTTGIVFAAGTIFTFLHGYDQEADITSKTNLIAIAKAAFLTVGELALVYLHSLIDSKEFWRRITAFVLSIFLAITITFAASSEAKIFVEENSLKTKAAIITQASKEEKATAQSRQERTAIALSSNRTLQEILKESKAQNFTPFAINFFFGLLCILTGALIQPREPWKRKSGNQLTPELRERARQKMGFDLPDTAKAYHNGRGDSYLIKNGREYITSVSARVDKES
jgi:amino acid transporter